MAPLSEDSKQSIETAINGLSALVSFVLGIGFMPPIFGYYWRWVGILRTEGYDAPAPVWQNDLMGTYWMDGAKAGVYLLIVYCALIIPAIPLLLIPLVGIVFAIVWLFIGIPLILPFLFASPVIESPRRSLAGLFNVKQSVEAGLNCFAEGAAAVVISIILSIVSIPVILFSCCTCVGYPVAINLFYVLVIHLFAQVFQGYNAPVTILHTSSQEPSDPTTTSYENTDAAQHQQHEAASDTKPSSPPSILPEIDLEDRRDH